MPDVDRDMDDDLVLCPEDASHYCNHGRRGQSNKDPFHKTHSCVLNT